MPPPIGVSFAPTYENAAEAGKNRQLSGAPLQDAIRVLALRLPRVLGVRSLGPGTADRPSMASGPESAVLQSMLGRPSPTGPGAAVPGIGSAAGAPSAPGRRPPLASAGVPNEAQQLMQQIEQEARRDLPAPNIIPGVGDAPQSPLTFTRPLDVSPPPREPRVPVGAPLTPDQTPGLREPRESRAPRVPAGPPAGDLVVAPPPPRAPQTPRDPNAPIDISPVPGGLNEMVEALVRELGPIVNPGGPRGSRRFGNF